MALVVATCVGLAHCGDDGSDANPVGPTSPRQGSPDLTVALPSVIDRVEAPASQFTLTAIVRNDGDEASPSTTLRYYRSADATIATSDTAAGTAPVAGIDSRGSVSHSVDLTAASSPGTYYYGACVDAVAGESDTTNNCSASVQVTVSEVEPPPPPSNPDLVVESPSVDDSSPAAGASFTLSATVRNAGDGASAGTTLRYYRSTDATIATSDTAAGTDPVGGLAASGSSSQSVDLTAPSTSGTYYYGACVDAVAGESDTANNCSASVRVTVSEVEPPPPPSNPDLVVESPSVDDSSPAAGASFTLSATVRNAGDGASAGTTLRYYRSTDATIATSDTAAGTDPVAGLAASGSSSQSVDLTALSTSGTYYYGACVDSVAGESDTANNCSASVRVTVSAVEPPPPPPQTHPDLMVESPSVSDGSPAAGAGFTLFGDGAERGRRGVGGHDAAVLPVDGRGDHDVGHGGGHGPGGGTGRVGEQQPVGGSDRAVDLRNLVLRCVRGRGGWRVGHGEQLLGVGAGHGIGGGAAAAEQPGPGGGVTVGG